MSVYLRAAELVDSGGERYSCHAISFIDATPDNWVLHDAEMECYVELFSPIANDDGYTIVRDWWCGDDTPKNRRRRVLALLFMHWISENP